MFDKMKKLFELQKTAKKMQTKLEAASISAEALDGKIKMEFNGKMELKTLDIDDSIMQSKDQLVSGIKSCYAQALQKSQTIAQEALKEMSGPMGYPEF